MNQNEVSSFCLHLLRVPHLPVSITSTQTERLRNPGFLTCSEVWKPSSLWRPPRTFTLRSAQPFTRKTSLTFHPEDLPDLSPPSNVFFFLISSLFLHTISQVIFRIHADESKMFYVKLVLLWNGIIINYLVLETSGILLGWVWFW